MATSLLAQDATNSMPAVEPAPMTTPAAPPAAPAAEPAPAMPAPAMEAPTNAPAAPEKKKTAKKKAARKSTRKTAARKPAPELKTVPLISGPAVVSANHVNVRSRAGLAGEVIAHMTNGEPVTVVEEVHLKNSGPEEPSAWAKIQLPSDEHVWIKSSLLDSNNAVAPKKVNLRAGPGEAYGVVGTLQRGEAVQTIDTKGDWTQIQAPTNAYAYMAAQYLKQGEEATTVASIPTPEPAPETNTMTEMPGMAPAPTEPPTTADTNAPAVATETPEPAPAATEPPPPRIVEHEGIVRGSFSIQAPTRYELVSPDTHQPIDYLYTATTNLDLGRYKGLHIIVTGEESLDERWKNTPVITIQRIQVLD
jgi:uncharacterized protein YgiM (DUF1202 family)